MKEIIANQDLVASCGLYCGPSGTVTTSLRMMCAFFLVVGQLPGEIHIAGGRCSDRNPVRQRGIEVGDFCSLATTAAEVA